MVGRFMKLKKSMMKRTTLREIKQSFGRYMAIFAIVLLGVGFFAGLRVTTTAMIETGDKYLGEHQFYDLRLVSTMGFQDEDVERVSKEEGVSLAKGSITMDFVCENDMGEESVLVAHSILENLNTPSLVQGEMPKEANECLIDAQMEGVKVGDTIKVSSNNKEDTKDLFQYDTYKVTGLINSPLYMNFERGSTSLLAGSVSGFVYIPLEGFDSEYYTEIYLRYDQDYGIYSKQYDDFMEDKTDSMELLCEELSTNRYESVMADAKEEIEDAKNELADKEAEAKEELDEAKADLDEAERTLKDAREELESNEAQLLDAKAQLKVGLKQVADSKTQLQAINMTFGPQWEAIVMQEEQLNAQLAEVNAGLKKIEEEKPKIEDSEKELADGREEYEEASLEFEQEIADAKEKIADAEAELEDIPKPDSYVLTRDMNIGYACFENDVNIVAGIALVFPIFFFMVAALVCITTMNRMVEEQRTQIGILKALGYSKFKIMSKYMFYSGSGALMGAVVGFFAGSYVFPVVIWEAYKLMYGFSKDVVFVLDAPLAVISLAVAAICSIGATYFSCYHELNSVAAELIRPKAPKGGKRIFLEKIGFIWNRLTFLQKVSVRNVVRYKKRFFMMVLGISGCSALLVAGFGIKDSISNLIPIQYETIQTYDSLVTFNEELTEEEKQDFDETVSDIVSEYLFVNEESVDLIANNASKSVTLVVPKESERLEAFVSLHTPEGEEIPFPEKGEAVITKKAADKLKVTVGDGITLRDADGRQTELIVSGVAENYVDSYAYILPESYEEGFAKKISYTNSFINLKNEENYQENNATISDLSYVASVSASRTFAERFNNMMTSLDYIVLLVIACAAALAFIVLYNLTNINITERIREIATIKVLGFYQNETSAYVFRENIVLTAIGALAGLILGKFLHAYIVYKIDLDAVTFQVYVAPISYVYSFVLTFVFAMFVNFMMRFKLKKINMAESLKSIE